MTSLTLMHQQAMRDRRFTLNRPLGLTSLLGLAWDDDFGRSAEKASWVSRCRAGAAVPRASTVAPTRQPGWTARRGANSGRDKNTCRHQCRFGGSLGYPLNEWLTSHQVEETAHTTTALHPSIPKWNTTARLAPTGAQERGPADRPGPFEGMNLS
jgi:hypothetical protein